MPGFQRQSLPVSLPGRGRIAGGLGQPSGMEIRLRITGPEAHGVPGLVNLFGFESPGLTASLAIAEAVGERLGVRARCE